MRSIWKANSLICFLKKHRPWMDFKSYSKKKAHVNGCFQENQRNSEFFSVLKRPCGLKQGSEEFILSSFLNAHSGTQQDFWLCVWCLVCCRLVRLVCHLNSLWLMELSEENRSKDLHGIGWVGDYSFSIDKSKKLWVRVLTTQMWSWSLSDIYSLRSHPRIRLDMQYWPRQCTFPSHFSAPLSPYCPPSSLATRRNGIGRVLGKGVGCKHSICLYSTRTLSPSPEECKSQ